MDPNNFHWTESYLESIEHHGQTLIIIADNVLIDDSNVPSKIKLSFFEVTCAERTVTEYLNEKPMPSYIVNDVLLESGLCTGKKYRIEGLTQFEPIAWLEFEIVANQHRVEKIDRTT